MKKIITISLFFLLVYAICNAGDFIVEFVEENYRETSSPVSYSPVIYHSIQVRSEAGPKVLILKGDNDYYRKWLRQYIAQGKQFIAQISDDRDDLFISSSAFEMDVTDLHPFNLGLYRQGEKKKSGVIQKSPYSGQFSDRTQSPIKRQELVKKQVDKGNPVFKKEKIKANKDKRRANLKEKAKKRKGQAQK